MCLASSEGGARVARSRRDMVATPRRALADVVPSTVAAPAVRHAATASGAASAARPRTSTADELMPSTAAVTTADSRAPEGRESSSAGELLSDGVGRRSAPRRAVGGVRKLATTTAQTQTARSSMTLLTVNPEQVHLGLGAASAMPLLGGW